MDAGNENYLEQELEWVKYRLKMLDEIEARLAEMKELAILAKDNELSVPQRQLLSRKIHALAKEVTQLDGKSKTFWLKCQ